MNPELTTVLETLKKGGIILYPTDTIWGIGCDATNAAAVEKIFSIKERDRNKGLIIIVSDESMLNRYVKEVPALAWDLIDASDPEENPDARPLTIIYPEGRSLAPGVCAPDGSIAVRLIRPATRAGQFCFDLIRKLNKPLVSTSANLSGNASPSHFDEIDSTLIEKVDHCVDSSIEDTGAQSSASALVKLELNGEVKVLR